MLTCDDEHSGWLGSRVLLLELVHEAIVSYVSYITLRLDVPFSHISMYLPIYTWIWPFSHNQQQKTARECKEVKQKLIKYNPAMKVVSIGISISSTFMPGRHTHTHSLTRIGTWFITTLSIWWLGGGKYLQFIWALPRTEMHNESRVRVYVLCRRLA